MTKENNGRAAARRKLLRIGMAIFGTFCITILCGGLYYCIFLSSSSSSYFFDDNNNNNNKKNHYSPRNLFLKDGTNNKVLRNRKNRNVQYPRHSQKKYPENNKPPPEDILNGYLHLIDIHIDSDEFDGGSNSNDGTTATTTTTYQGVYGTFCRLDWSVHKKDPSAYPMFRDLVAASSSSCDGERMEHIPIHTLIRHVRAFDANQYNELPSSSGDNNLQGMTKANVLKIGGFVFHESRCGSTLVANLFNAIYPDQHRVYSESGPPVTALKICGEQYEHCSKQVAARIFQDVIYLMSRSDHPMETTVFFKIQSIGSRNIDVFHEAYPNVPYMFVYRDPVQVLMSQLKLGTKRANCVRPQHHHPLPRIVQEITNKYASDVTTNAEELPGEFYCAVHLASLTETVVKYYNKNERTNGIVVNYNVLPDAFYTHIVPNHFHITVTDDALERMKQTATKYSKGRGGKNAGDFQSDSEQKEHMANEIIKNAALLFLQPSYMQLEQLTPFHKDRDDSGDSNVNDPNTKDQ